jgi:putative transposase
MRLAYKYRIQPTRHQAEFLAGELREACSLYNAALQERTGAWKICRKSITFYDQCRQLPAMRADGCLTLVNAQCAQNVLHRIDNAFKDFFGRVRRGEKPGFPRYRPAQRYNSLTFPHYGNGCRLLDTGKLRLQGAGHIKVNLHRPLRGTIKTLTIKREADRWFACFSVECETRPMPPSDRATGVDMGLSSFAVLANGTKIENPRHYRNAEARLRRCQRKVTRRKKGGNRRLKAVQLLQRANVHVRNQRADFHHKLSRQLVNKHGVIAVEDLNVEGLAGGVLAKSVRDAGWATFMQMLSYKAESAGRVLVKVDPRGTSQTCTCGQRVPKTLKDRWHDCPACGLSASRDHVSAQVILQRSAGNPPSGVNVEEVISCVA